jgi:hypothetical protein
LKKLEIAVSKVRNAIFISHCEILEKGIEAISDAKKTVSNYRLGEIPRSAYGELGMTNLGSIFWLSFF